MSKLSDRLNKNLTNLEENTIVGNNIIIGCDAGNINEGFTDTLDKLIVRAEGKPKFGQMNFDKVKIVSTDISKETEQLHTTMRHFFETFDNAYDKNGTDLYDTKDLEDIMMFCKRIVADFKSGKSATWSGQGDLVTTVNISPAAVQRLYNDTMTATNKLNNIFKQSFEIAERTISVLASKQAYRIQMAGFMTVNDARTNKILLGMADAIESRIKEGQHIQKGFLRVQEQFIKLRDTLQAERNVTVNISNISFDSADYRSLLEAVALITKILHIVRCRMYSFALFQKYISRMAFAIAALTDHKTLRSYFDSAEQGMEMSLFPDKDDKFYNNVIKTMNR